MKFSNFSLFFGALLAAFMHASLDALEPEINLTGRKDLVLSIERRQTVLEVGAACLATETKEVLPLIGDLDDPFRFEVAAVNEIEEVSEPEPLVYADADVLALSAPNFAKKVRGSIARGGARYLQLEKGVLLEPGTSFPIRLPQAENQTFTVTITEITPQGYTLQIGEATKQLNFDGESQSNPVEFTNP